MIIITRIILVLSVFPVEEYSQDCNSKGFPSELEQLFKSEHILV
jgi:hypothetical protein